MYNRFTHLHLHTEYSFLDGSIKIDSLLKRVFDLKMQNIAITDHGNMFGVMSFYKKSKEYGIKPIIGMEAYITGKSSYTDKIKENYHIILLAETTRGYHNLIKLASQGYMNGMFYFPRIDKKLLKKYREGLIATTACLSGEVGVKCQKGDYDGARDVVREYKSIFGLDNFFIEIQNTGTLKQKKINPILMQIAKDEKIRIVGTNNCHYLEKEHHEAQNILMAIRQQKIWNDPTVYRHETDQYYVKSEKEMKFAFQDMDEGIESACDIGKRCLVDLNRDSLSMPQFSSLWNKGSVFSFFKKLVFSGIDKRFKEVEYKVNKDEYFARLNAEFTVLTEMGFSHYFLVVQDFINWAKNSLISVGPGRGSGAGSLIAYALRITDIDPIIYDLYFERFLNPERVSMPDFDVDFMQKGREDVVKYVENLYGNKMVANIATFGALSTKATIKDVGRTLNFTFDEINVLTTLLTLVLDKGRINLDKIFSLKNNKVLRKSRSKRDYRDVFRFVQTLDGLYRQAGKHAGGIVIAGDILTNIIPLFTGLNNEITTQYEKHCIDNLGLIKFDFLGLKTLDLVNTGDKLIKERINKFGEYQQKKDKISLYKNENTKYNIIGFDISLIPPTDKNVFKILSSGSTLGIFQVESPGFQELCLRIKPDNFEDLMAAVALYRPGPMKTGMVEDFIERKTGVIKSLYPHILLEPVLKTTYGSFIYQEQVMQSAQVISGYSMGAADILRRAMGKKKSSEMKIQKLRFINGAGYRKIKEDEADYLFELIKKFAGYAFNKSHSAAYALISYQTAYIKKYYPIEFMGALLICSDTPVEVVRYIFEARSKLINIEQPNLNKSFEDLHIDYYEIGNEPKDFNINYGSIIFGLNSIKGLGENVYRMIIKNRLKYGDYVNVYDFCLKTDISVINKNKIELLIKSGTFDLFKLSRKFMYASLKHILNMVLYINQRKHNKKNIVLFRFLNEMTDTGEFFVYRGEWNLKNILKAEREALGYYITENILLMNNLGKAKYYDKSFDLEKKDNRFIILYGIVVASEWTKFKKKRYIGIFQDMWGSTLFYFLRKDMHLVNEYVKAIDLVYLKGLSIWYSISRLGYLLKQDILLLNLTREDNRIKDKNLIRIYFPFIKSMQEYIYLFVAIYKLCLNFPGTKRIHIILEDQEKYQIIYMTKTKVKIKITKLFINLIKYLSDTIMVFPTV